MEMKMNDNSTVCHQMFVLIFQSYIEEGKGHDVSGPSAPSGCLALLSHFETQF